MLLSGIQNYHQRITLIEPLDSRLKHAGMTRNIRTWFNMIINREIVAQHLSDYLSHKSSRAQLVDWAESALMDSEFDEKDSVAIKPIVARLGLADVKEFGVTWDDCYNFLMQLGYHVNVVISRAA
jgi:hypothetical protein